MVGGGDPPKNEVIIVTSGLLRIRLGAGPTCEKSSSNRAISLMKKLHLSVALAAAVCVFALWVPGDIAAQEVECRFFCDLSVEDTERLPLEGLPTRAFSPSMLQATIVGDTVWFLADQSGEIQQWVLNGGGTQVWTPIRRDSAEVGGVNALGYVAELHELWVADAVGGRLVLLEGRTPTWDVGLPIRPLGGTFTMIDPMTAFGAFVDSAGQTPSLRWELDGGLKMPIGDPIEAPGEDALVRYSPELFSLFLVPEPGVYTIHQIATDGTLLKTMSLEEGWWAERPGARVFDLRAEGDRLYVLGGAPRKDPDELEAWYLTPDHWENRVDVYDLTSGRMLVSKKIRDKRALFTRFLNLDTLLGLDRKGEAALWTGRLEDGLGR